MSSPSGVVQTGAIYSLKLSLADVALQSGVASTSFPSTTVLFSPIWPGKIRLSVLRNPAIPTSYGSSPTGSVKPQHAERKRPYSLVTSEGKWKALSSAFALHLNFLDLGKESGILRFPCLASGMKAACKNGSPVE
ncbi:hypothetical protein H2248_000329 [Termitomyces sp. 'cryptogamus']|nr:hypothetical protein H2248_000329 [Termitomyces sp. 'cryptogamus']